MESCTGFLAGKRDENSQLLGRMLRRSLPLPDPVIMPKEDPLATPRSILAPAVTSLRNMKTRTRTSRFGIARMGLSERRARIW